MLIDNTFAKPYLQPGLIELGADLRHELGDQMDRRQASHCGVL